MIHLYTNLERDSLAVSSLFQNEIEIGLDVLAIGTPVEGATHMTICPLGALVSFPY